MNRTSDQGLNLRLATALLESFRSGYTRRDLRSDILAGITVGIVAVPLAMALAIASGVPPQHGLYTAIIAGLIIALAGGSRLSVSGPTAAFVVILHPIAVQYGIGGLLMATLLAGVILVALGVARMGRLIQFIPYPVTTGFTAGIGVVIATLQIKDFFGLELASSPEHYIDRVGVLYAAVPTAHLADFVVGATTLAVLILWPRLKSAVPGHLVALIVGTLLAIVLAHTVDGFQVATVGSRFQYELGGVLYQGIPQLPPLPAWPWNFPGPDGKPLVLSWALINSLMGPAFAIAILGAIESLLCAVVVDGLAGTKHDPDTELTAQGLGNILVPFFGGIAATGAIARSATNFRAGAVSPLSAAIHAVFILAVVLVLAPLLGHLPMASLAALLLMVAWNMSEARHFVHIVKIAPRGDVAVLLTCFVLTVIFDMVVAVGVGMMLAAFLFMRRVAEITNARKLDQGEHEHLHANLPPSVQIYEIAGPLFFGAAEKAISSLEQIGQHVKIVVLDMGGVPAMDVTGVVALDSIIKRLNKRHVCVVLAGVQHAPAKVLQRAGISHVPGQLAICANLIEAMIRVREKLAAQEGEAVTTAVSPATEGRV